jgi:SAM-dependent methyltransferase
VTGPIYGSLNPPVAARVPASARRVLDVGCGDGTLGAHLRARQGAEVTGITYSEAEAALARPRLAAVWVADLHAWAAPAGGAPFDALVASHVLEHLAEPARLLRELRRCLAPGGVLVVALPNVLHWRQRAEFLRGRFRYSAGGLMDATHLRFFDWAGAAQLLRDGGWELTSAAAFGGWPGSRFLGPLRPRLDAAAGRLAPGLFGFQFVFTARLPPSSAAKEWTP